MYYKKGRYFCLMQNIPLFLLKSVFVSVFY
nr:MAG TPA: hypothetical protein [Caudoviricetes sp.]